MKSKVNLVVCCDYAGTKDCRFYDAEKSVYLN